MEVAVERVKKYINELKTAGNFSAEDIANLSGIPIQTVKNILSGKTPDARFGTVAKIVLSLGGDLNGLIGEEKKKEVEINSMVSMKETYEMRIADIINSYEQRISDIKEMCELRISDVKKMYEERLQEQKGCESNRYVTLK